MRAYIQPDMHDRGFQFNEDPERPGRLLHTRENFEINRWVMRRERRCWQRLVAFQLMFGALLWVCMYGVR